MRIRSALLSAALFGCSLTAYAAECSYNASGEVTTTTGCETAASSYTVKIYKVGLCTAAPVTSGTTAGATADVSSCKTVFESASGSSISITKGASTDLSGTFTEPTAGVNYTYAYVVAGTDVQLQAKVSFAAAQTVVDNSASAVAGKGTGQKCWTLASSYRDSVDLGGANEYKTLDCGGSFGTAGTVTETIDALDVGVACAGNANLAGCTTNDSLTTISGGGVTVTRLLYVSKNASAISYTSGKALDLAWSVSQGIGMGSAGPNSITRMIAGPISVSFSLK